MAKTYLGVDNISQKVKRIYSGVGGVAKKIKTGYIGVNNIAQKIFGSSELVYHGNGIADPFEVNSRPSAANVGNYAIFAHFHSSVTPKNIYVCDNLLTRIDSVDDLDEVSYSTATNFGEYALFAGGNNGGRGVSDVFCYNKSLTKLEADFLSLGRYNLAATAVGDYALVGGGRYSSSSSTTYNTVDVYNKSLTRLSPISLSTTTECLSAATLGNYALFDGGSNSTNVDVFDTSLTRRQAQSKSGITYYNAATKVGGYVLFAGGYSSAVGGVTNIVEAYDNSLTKSLPTELDAPTYQLAATTLGDYALFGGGDTLTTNDYPAYDSSTSATNIVNAYDTSLIRTLPTAFKYPKYGLAATSVGDYAIFSGGENSFRTAAGDIARHVVDTYTLS